MFPTSPIVACLPTASPPTWLVVAENGTIARVDPRSPYRISCLRDEGAGDVADDARDVACAAPWREDHVLVGRGRTVHHWDPRSPHTMRPVAYLTHMDEDDEINALAVHPSSRVALGVDDVVAVASDDGSCLLLDINDGAEVRRARQPHTNVASSVRVALTYPHAILTGGLDCAVMCWDATSG